MSDTATVERPDAAASTTRCDGGAEVTLNLPEKAFSTLSPTATGQPPGALPR